MTSEIVIMGIIAGLLIPSPAVPRNSVITLLQKNNMLLNCIPKRQCVHQHEKHVARLLVGVLAAAGAETMLLCGQDCKVLTILL